MTHPPLYAASVPVVNDDDDVAPWAVGGANLLNAADDLVVVVRDVGPCRRLRRGGLVVTRSGRGVLCLDYSHAAVLAAAPVSGAEHQLDRGTELEDGLVLACLRKLPLE